MILAAFLNNRLPKFQVWWPVYAVIVLWFTLDDLRVHSFFALLVEFPECVRNSLRYSPTPMLSDCLEKSG